VSSPTGDHDLDALLPAASRLVCGLRDWDNREVAIALDLAVATPGPYGGDQALTSLVCLLGCMVPPCQSFADLLAWTQREHELRRLMAAGVSRSIADTIVNRPIERG
jgi:hypothetical protein